MILQTIATMDFGDEIEAVLDSLFSNSSGTKHPRATVKLLNNIYQPSIHQLQSDRVHWQVCNPIRYIVLATIQARPLREYV